MILYVPYFEMSIKEETILGDLRPSGLGHLTRCIRNAAHTSGAIFLEERYHSYAEKLLQTYIKILPKEIISQVEFIEELTCSFYDAIVLDMPEATKSQIKSFSQYGPVIGIDLGGEAREYTSYLIDTLPNSFTHLPNIYQLGASIDPFLVAKDKWSSTCQKILFYSNSQHLDDEIICIQKMLRDKRIELNIITKDVKLYKTLLAKYNNLKLSKFTINNFLENLHKFDVFITHFGLGAYEAISAKVPVILLNHTSYHAKLSQIANFPIICNHTNDNQKQGYEELIEHINNICNNELQYTDLIMNTKYIVDYEKISQTTDGKKGKFLADLLEQTIESYKKTGMKQVINPWQGQVLEKSVYRNEDKTIFYCDTTAQWHQISFSEKFPRYDKKYFFTDYQKQYGSTYIEDYSSILQVMRRRMKIIQRSISKQNRTQKHIYKSELSGKKILKYRKDIPKTIVCDLGCAYGAMLQASAEQGYMPVGIEASKEAATYASKIHRSKVICANIEVQRLKKLLKKIPSNTKIVAITGFYLIEHIKNLQLLLSDIHEALADKGVVAFSLPNGDGISARKNMKKFYSESPLDHFSIFTPKGIRYILEKSGFKVRKICVTGHHPERFGLPAFFHPFLKIMSRIYKLGDTFEVYAIKKW